MTGNPQIARRIALERGWSDLYAREDEERLRKQCAQVKEHRRKLAAGELPPTNDPAIGREKGALGNRLRRAKVSLAVIKLPRLPS